MDPNKFMEKAQGAITDAQNIATRSQHRAVDVEHVALAFGLVNRQGRCTCNWRA